MKFKKKNKKQLKQEMCVIRLCAGYGQVSYVYMLQAAGLSSLCTIIYLYVFGIIHINKLYQKCISNAF